jgi:calcineurin-like phosphoesterase family protein
MNEVIVHRWNEKVGKEDQVYLLGDISFKGQFDWRSRLNGRITVIAGNHDGGEHKLVKGYLKYGGEFICLSHRPEEADTSKRVCLVGHVHTRWTFRRTEGGFMCNVGTDQWGFAPVTFEEIMKEWKRVSKLKKEKIETWQKVEAPLREEFKNETVDSKTEL